MSNKGTLWIGDLDPYIDEAFLKQAFLLMGETLYEAKIIRSKYDGSMHTSWMDCLISAIHAAIFMDSNTVYISPLGYGFLEFADEQTAQRVLHRCNGKIIPNSCNSKRFKLNHANYGKESTPQKEYSLFVGDLTADVDDLALFNAFSSRYSSVKAGKVVFDSSGVSKGYGFVRFTNETEYQTALVEMQNAHVVGSKPIRVSVATPKRANMPGIPGQEYQQCYQYPGYDYQSYYAAWQNYQNPYYNYNYDQSYGTYDASYHQPQQQQQQQQPPQQHAPQPQAHMQQGSQYYGTAYDTSDNAIEEHDTAMDIEQLNEEIISRNEELYNAIDDSRWLPVEGLNPPLIKIK